MDTSNRDRLCQILNFWHKVEFFIPFDLRGQVLHANDAQWNAKHVTFSELQELPHNASGDLWTVARLPEGKQVTRFDLYLGVFDKKLLTKVFQNAISEETEIDQEERIALDGETCFAKLRLNAQGEPLFDKFSVSTVPWALGCVERSSDVSCLTLANFQSSLQQLRNDLDNFQVRRKKNVEESTQSHRSLPLTRSDLEELLSTFYTWAGFKPNKNESSLAVIRAIVGKKPTFVAKPNDSSKSMPERNEELSELGDDENRIIPPDEIEIDILNSFYIKDIEKAIDSIQQGQPVPLLEAYLTPLHEDDRINLYSDVGRQRIISDLDPSNIPSAHWFDESSHVMSLMQQFAINNVFSEQPTNCLFSVNGPPGTGKTTLLRDIFAENITKRARILASLKTAQDAFLSGSKSKVIFAGQFNEWKISLLKPELTGFEMIVASSNNAAVNNISEDLPKSKSLGASQWRTEKGLPKQTYLQPVATKIATQTANGGFSELEPDDVPWGLISCALGKSANRYKFADRLLSSIITKEKKPKGYDPVRHQSIKEWSDRYKGSSFQGAKKAFEGLDKKVRKRQERLKDLVCLISELSGHTEDSYTSAETQLLSNAQEAIRLEENSLEKIDNELVGCGKTLSILKEEEKLIPTPTAWEQLLSVIPSTGFWQNLTREKCRMNLDDLNQNRDSQRKCLQTQTTLSSQKEIAVSRLNKAKSERDLTKDNRERKVKEWRGKEAELNHLRFDFSKAEVPEFPKDLEEPQWQENGIWYDPELNELRSQLFAASLNLHEAWLSEVIRKDGGLLPNLFAIGKLLKGEQLTTPEHALALWQSLFMVVPVVSSTFASIAAQFKELGANALGWLFIDEAGQAVPQAATGALWRTKRAVVVGDPLQIEPVFNVPVELVKELLKSSHLPENTNVSPHTVSVQTLADAANCCGALVQGSENEPQWIGSPLRVHRRCADPMFQIANNIAYENKMVFGLKSTTPPVDDYDIGASAWVHVSGITDGKHVVPAQVNLVTKAVMNLYQSRGKLPPLYIISPFKRVKFALIDSLSDKKTWEEYGITTLSKGNTLKKWCSTNIGTVHTFQGKEERIVWMVLGCDKSSEGAVSWAASKPNILNVGLTRAKHRFFMIGDIELWGDKRYFNTAKSHLPPISQTDFLDRL